MKKLLTWMLVCCVLLSMGACRSSQGDLQGNGTLQEETKDETTIATSETTVPEESIPDPIPVTMKVSTPYEDQAEGENWLERMEQAFQAEHPEYEIQWINEMMAEGDVGNCVRFGEECADVFIFPTDQLSGMVEAGGLVRLGGSYLEQVQNDNSQMVVDAATHTDGGVYGFPIANVTWIMYYDKDVFTPEDVQSLDTMLEKGKVCVPFNVSWNAGAFFLGTGCTVFGTDGNDAAAGIQFGGEAGYQAARKMIQLVAHPNCVAGGMDPGKLMDGEVDAVFSGSWSKTELEAALGDRLGAAPLPSFQIDGEEHQMKALSGAKCVGVSPRTSTQEGKQMIAMAFAAFLASPDGQLERYHMSGIIPAAQALAEDETIRSDSVAVAEIETMSRCSVVQPSLPEMNSYWLPMEALSVGIVNGEVTMENYVQMVDMMMQEMGQTDPGQTDTEQMEMITVHARVHADWEDIHCWAWSQKETASDGFPGEPMRQEGQWYVIEMPAWIEALLIYGDDANGGAHSGDLFLEPGRDVWIDVYGQDMAEVYYTDPDQL
ncbi:MAG: extracellular solute-binding protein [Oscillospiraceae bacterium]|nr:extracellular solute-binding protein [Oscillospiraceae bacterium]